jgi:hypothetical protein
LAQTFLSHFRQNVAPVTCLYRHRGGGSIGVAPLILHLGSRWCGGTAPRSGRFTLRKKPGTLCKGGWAGPWTGLDCYGKRKCLAPVGFELRTVQPVASRYNDWAIPASLMLRTVKIYQRRLTV